VHIAAGLLFLSDSALDACMRIQGVAGPQATQAMTWGVEIFLAYV
jgi:hypothetical protein